jgi:hypothetical protein
MRPGFGRGVSENSMKRMMHPQHGFHNAIDANEEARMRLNGWVDDVPVESAPVPEVEQVEHDEAQAEAAPAKRAYVRKAK